MGKWVIMLKKCVDVMDYRLFLLFLQKYSIREK